jgi:hypothetical protein
MSQLGTHHICKSGKSLIHEKRMTSGCSTKSSTILVEKGLESNMGCIGVVFA